MVSSQDIKNSVLSIPEQRFFESTGGSFIDMQIVLQNALSATDFRGVAINAPTSIALKQYAILPILIAIRKTGLRGWEVPRNANCMLMATDLSRRTTYFGQVFRPPQNKTPMPGHKRQPPGLKPTGADAVSMGSQVSRIDAREVLSLPWEPGRYRFTVLLFDWMSNAVDVELTDGNTAPAASAPPLKLNPAVGKNHGLPTFLANATTLPPAEKNLPSVAFQVAMASARNPQLNVTGKFSLVADAFHLPVAPYKVKEADGQEKTVAAAVPTTLVLLRKGGPNPLPRNWVLPVYADQPIKAGERVEGYFSIDALAEDKFPLAAGDYVAYLVIEGHMVGPVAFSSVAAVK